MEEGGEEKREEREGEIKKRKNFLEASMQNSGLATALAKSSFPNYSLATVPGAVFSIIHNVTGALLANVFKRM